ncbi:DUF6266 family protein [Parapedobacter koreensis]|uniref:Uncharacterized protein n=1 Tax=Parapedobacter koreensis TaxID=332977 RepID=A0A1H7TVP3_9SPHI|nr:DUF6266 family protein [Parapedobacter koreensis]SEL88811.1 hypothetical protein SAMN05421740_112117 [Parapedobacter koreensis]
MNIISNTTERRKSSEIDGRLPIRQRFKLASEFLMPLHRLIRRGFATKRKGKSAFGRAMSYVLLRAVCGEYPDQYIDPAAVRLSEGVLQHPIRTEVTRQGRTVRVAVESRMGDLDGLNQAWDDRLVLCAYNPALRVAGINDEERLREDGNVTLKLPPMLADKPVHLYLIVHDRSGQKWSNSKYLGEF